MYYTLNYFVFRVLKISLLSEDFFCFIYYILEHFIINYINNAYFLYILLHGNTYTNKRLNHICITLTINHIFI